MTCVHRLSAASGPEDEVGDIDGTEGGNPLTPAGMGPESIPATEIKAAVKRAKKGAKMKSKTKPASKMKTPKKAAAKVAAPKAAKTAESRVYAARNLTLSAFARKVASVRKKKGLTQKQLAEKVGCSQGHLANIESGGARGVGGKFEGAIRKALGLKKKKA